MVYFGLAMEQGADVYKDAENLVLVPRELVAVRRAGLTPCSELARELCRVEIKAQHDLTDFLEGLYACGFPRFVPGVRLAKYHVLLRPDRVVGACSFDLEEGSAGVDLHVRHGHHFSDPAGKGCNHLSLHLHGFEHGQAISNFNGIARLYRDGNDHGRGGGMDHAPVVSIHLMGHSVHFNVRTHALAYRDDMEATPEDGQPTFKLIQAVDVGLDAHAVDLDPIILRTEAVSLHRVEAPAIAQGQDATDFTAHLWPAAGRGCVELSLLYGQLRVVGIDCGLHQSHVGVFPGKMIAVRRDPVEPADIDLATLHFLAAQHFQQKRFVAGAALDDDDAFAQRPLEPGQSLSSALTVGDYFGDHGVEIRGNGVALGDTGVDPHAGAGHEAETLQDAGCGGKRVVGVFRIQPHLDRVAGGTRGSAFQTSAARHVDLKFHQVETGGTFGDRMLNLQTGVDLHEEKLAGLRLVEELHRAGIAVARGLAQANGGFAQVVILLRGKSGGKALLRALSDGGAGSCNRARRPPRSFHSGRRGLGLRRGARPRRVAREKPRGRRRP